MRRDGAIDQARRRHALSGQGFQTQVVERITSGISDGKEFGIWHFLRERQGLWMEILLSYCEEQ